MRIYVYITLLKICNPIGQLYKFLGTKLATRTHTHTHIHIHTYTHAHTHTHIHIHTHTQFYESTPLMIGSLGKKNQIIA